MGDPLRRHWLNGVGGAAQLSQGIDVQVLVADHHRAAAREPRDTLVQRFSEAVRQIIQRLR